ncbi:hypothetical protein AYB33_15915 [Leptospira santarosai]|nr:hypothetical protein AYB33_15915 [Leptospira santarosai]
MQICFLQFDKNSYGVSILTKTGLPIRQTERIREEVLTESNLDRIRNYLCAESEPSLSENDRREIQT